MGTKLTTLALCCALAACTTAPTRQDAALFATASAHTTALCSCSSPSNPGGVTVLFGTYHGASQSVGSGTCKLGNVASGASEGAFAGSIAVNIPSSTSVASLTNKVKAAAGAKLVPGTNKRFIYADSTCQCYNTDPGMASSSTIEYLSPVAQTASGHCYNSNIRAFHMATLQNQNSGTFSVELVGTNDVLAPIGSKAPCSTIEGKKNFINIDISDGGAKCMGYPAPVAGVVDATRAACYGTSSGGLCGVTCSDPNAVRLGEIKCTNGAWESNLVCSTEKTCKLGDLSIGGSDSNAVSGTGCGLFTEAGSTCTFEGCAGALKFSADTVHCNSEGQWATNGGICSAARNTVVSGRRSRRRCTRPCASG